MSTERPPSELQQALSQFPQPPEDLLKRLSDLLAGQELTRSMAAEVSRAVREEVDRAMGLHMKEMQASLEGLRSTVAEAIAQEVRRALALGFLYAALALAPGLRQEGPRQEAPRQEAPRWEGKWEAVHQALRQKGCLSWAELKKLLGYTPSPTTLERRGLKRTMAEGHVVWCL